MRLRAEAEAVPGVREDTQVGGGQPPPRGCCLSTHPACIGGRRAVRGRSFAWCARAGSTGELPRRPPPPAAARPALAPAPPPGAACCPCPSQRPCILFTALLLPASSSSPHPPTHPTPPASSLGLLTEPLSYLRDPLPTLHLALPSPLPLPLPSPALGLPPPALPCRQVPRAQAHARPQPHLGLQPHLHDRLRRAVQLQPLCRHHAAAPGLDRAAAEAHPVAARLPLVQQVGLRARVPQPKMCGGREGGGAGRGMEGHTRRAVGNGRVCIMAA